MKPEKKKPETTSGFNDTEMDFCGLDQAPPQLL